MFRKKGPGLEAQKSAAIAAMEEAGVSQGISPSYVSDTELAAASGGAAGPGSSAAAALGTGGAAKAAAVPEAAAGKPVDLTDVRVAIAQAMHDRSHDDGSYGPLWIRFAWHTCGTWDKDKRTGGSNGGTMRFVSTQAILTSACELEIFSESLACDFRALRSRTRRTLASARPSRCSTGSTASMPAPSRRLTSTASRARWRSRCDFSLLTVVVCTVSLTLLLTCLTVLPRSAAVRRSLSRPDGRTSRWMRLWRATDPPVAPSATGPTTPTAPAFQRPISARRLMRHVAARCT